MIDPAVLWTFVPAALALNLTPGADMMFCLGQGLRGGPRAALAADAGIALGCLVTCAIAGAGLGAVIAAMPLAFDVIRWLGVGYLLYLAVQALRSRPEGAAPPLRPARAFVQALMVNLTNPKVILFILAFLPQFTDPARPVLPQFLMLGAILSLGGLIVNGAVGLSASGFGRRLARARALSLLSAGVFSALALRLALMERF